MIAHTPSTPDPERVPESSFHIISRNKSLVGGFGYRKLPELSAPFGMNRSPPFQFMCRLRAFPPNLTDAVIVASTASTDVSLVTRSKVALSGDVPPEKATDVYTATMMADDSRRAQLPMTENLMDTSPIGVALDLSSKEKVKRPLPKEEYDESSTPLPALMVLNNEGILATWWFVYAESIRNGTAYPGLVAASSEPNQNSQPQQQLSPFATASTPSSSTFAGSSFGKTSTPSGLFGGPQNSNAASAFGAGANPSSAFGAPSGMGQKPSPWGGGTTVNQTPGSTFGQPTFGAPSAVSGITQGSSFGMTAGLGNRSSPWGTSSPSVAPATGNSFGQPSKMGSQASPFGSSTTGTNTVRPPSSSASGGFASFADSKGFAAAAPSLGSTQSIFGKPSTSNPFATGGASGSSADGPSIFGQPQWPAGSSNALASNFSLGSTFKGDGSAATDRPKPTGDVSNSLFGSNFGMKLGEATPAQSKDAEMNEDDYAPSRQSTKRDEPTTSESAVPKPASTPLTVQKGEPLKSSNLFGTLVPSKEGPKDSQMNKNAGFSFGSTTPASKGHPQEIKSDNLSRPSVNTSPKIKEEPHSDDDISSLNDEEARPPEGYGSDGEAGDIEKDKSPETPVRSATKLPEAPLPPESTSKSTYAAGDSSNSSKSSDDAPLPPDFVPQKTKLQEVRAASPPIAKLPEDSAGEDESSEGGEVDDDDEPNESLDDEGSGIDVAQEISPASSKESSKITSGSSFGFTTGKNSPENVFSTAQKQGKPGRVSLFGELGKPPVPLFPPSKPQESPRSPSPIRSGSALDRLRPDNPRSISAPGPMRAPDQPSIAATKAPTKAQPSPKEIREKETERSVTERSKQLEREHQSLSDEEDEQYRRLLAADIVPSKALDNFIAHQDYVRDVGKSGIPGSIEKVFRDINSMIDTLGLNSRSLMAFTKANDRQSRPEDVDKKDLEDLDDWCLIDVEALDAKENKLLSQLEERRLQDVSEKLANVRAVQSAASQMQRQSRDLSRTISINKESSHTQSSAQRPLDLDQQTQLRDLRKTFKNFQKQLADAEEGIMLLRTRLSSQTNGHHANGKPAMKQPTVEAVENTIRKMTHLIAQKSEDIDQLSSQLQDLSIPSPLNSGWSDGADHGDSTQGTPFSGSSSKRYNNAFGRSGHRLNATASPYRQSPLRASASASNGTPDVSTLMTQEEIEGYQARMKRKQGVNEVVKAVFGKSGVRVRALD